MHDRMFSLSACSSNADDSKPLAYDGGYSSDKRVACHAGFSSVTNPSACHSCDAVAVHSSGAAQFSPTSDDMDAFPLNLKVVPSRSTLGISDPCPGQVSHVIQESAVVTTGANNRQQLTGLSSSVALDEAETNVNIALHGTRTTQPLSLHSPG